VKQPERPGELPSFESIPDRNSAAGLPSKRWRLPETEIDIALIENGPRSGEYLVSAGTVDRLPEFYERVKNLPYKPGPAAELSDVYRKLSAGGTATIYEAYLSSPVGLERIVPISWMLRLPAWAKSPIAGVAPWQWLGLTVGLAVCLGFIYGIYRLNRHRAGRRAEESGPSWNALLTPLAIILVTAFPVPLLYAIFRVGGTGRIVITFCRPARCFSAPPGSP
jgi:MscS family membrane protein